MTPQQILDTVHQHLIDQGKQAMDGGGCHYRRGNLKCAVGCLIPDDLYKPEMEGKGAGTLIGKHRELLFLRRHRSLVGDLQTLHDNGGIHVWPERWEAFVNDGIANIAEGHGLAFTPRTKGQQV